MKRSFLPVALLLAGCAQLPGAAPDGRTLARAVGPASGPAQDCISVSGSEGLTVLADRTLGYRSGGTVWVNHMPEQCRLSTFSTVIVERHGSQICRGDRIRTLEPGSTIAGPSCMLGQFVPHAPR